MGGNITELSEALNLIFEQTNTLYYQKNNNYKKWNRR
jgi:hypothetical protein